MHKLTQILLVDDDEVTNFINEEIVKEAGIAEEISTAENGLEALNQIKNTAGNKNGTFVPELILLDINMPEMNGYEFLEAIKNQLNGSSKPKIIIMLTTNLIDEDNERLESYKEFVAGIIEKPLNREALLSIYKEHFSK